jgi:transposase-like protein
MAKLDINQKHFHDEDAAREYLENIRWRDGKPVCPHCGSINKHYELKPKTSDSALRKGVWKCKDCRKQFSVTVGTVFERSHIPLNKWLLAVQLMCSSKKGMSAKQIERMLGVTYKTAWFMMHRIRHAMEQKIQDKKLKGIVEADETYVGGKGKGTRGRGSKSKSPVFSLVERNGKVRSFPVQRVTAKNLKEIIRNNVDETSTIVTDEFKSYQGLDKEYPYHYVINHGEKEYVNGIASTNTIEGYFSILKRGIIGVYQHVGKQHLHRYLAEFDFRYNAREINDFDRSDFALYGIGGKRLLYRDS